MQERNPSTNATQKVTPSTVDLFIKDYLGLVQSGLRQQRIETKGDLHFHSTFGLDTLSIPSIQLCKY